MYYRYFLFIINDLINFLVYIFIFGGRYVIILCILGVSVYKYMDWWKCWLLKKKKYDKLVDF